MVSGVPDKPHLQLPFQPVDHQAGGQLGKRLQRALENLRKQHKWGAISDEKYRTERSVLVRQLKLLNDAVKPRHCLIWSALPSSFKTYQASGCTLG